VHGNVLAIDRILATERYLVKTFLRLGLLSASLLWAIPAPAADLLITHVRGYTLQAGRPALVRFDALLVEGGKVVAVGTARQLAPRAGKARRVDGQGRVLLPGLIDAHGHVMALGFKQSRVDLSGAATLQAALALIKTDAVRHPEGQWLRGRGWNQVVWRLERFPTAVELDTAVADRPAWLERVDGHAGWANSKALQLAGITRATPDPPGGKILRDPDGNPTGVLVDAAMQLVTRVLPEPTEAEAQAAFQAAMAAPARSGHPDRGRLRLSSRICQSLLRTPRHRHPPGPAG
jgi:hypothetical protein